MKVFLKYISHSMFEKKGRFFLLLFSIAISAALLVASAGMVDIVIDSLNAPYESGHMADLEIVSKKDDPFMKKGDIKEDGMKDIVYQLQTTGVINENDKIKYVSLVGRTAYDGQMVEGTADFLGTAKAEDRPSCIISKRIADAMKLSKGDTLTLYLAGVETKLQVTAITADEKMFYSDRAEAFHLLLPYEYLNEKMDADGGYNVVLANVTEGNAEDFAKSFNEANPSFQATAPGVTAIGTDSMTAGLYSMLAIVAIVSAIIIHGVFKLILTERMSVIGTFMSQGATKKKVERIILMEGMLYGIFGGIIGAIIGETLLFFLGRLTSPLAEYGIYNAFSINPVHIVIGLIFAIVLCVISAYFPVRSIRKLQTKDVILNQVDRTKKNRIVKPIIGIALLAFATTIYFIYENVNSVFSPIAFVAAYAGVVLLVPAVVKVITGLLCKAFRSNTTLFLTMNNIRSSKLLRNNIVLIVVSLSSVLMISSFGKSMTALVVDAYDKMNYEFSISGIMETDPHKATTDQIVEKIKSIDGVEESEVNPIYFNEGTVDGYNAVITGINPDNYADLLDEYFNFKTKHREEFKALRDSTDNAIILTSKVAKHTGKTTGDTVTINVNSQDFTFRVVGVYDGKVFNGGVSVLVRDDVSRDVFHIKEASEIYISPSGNPEAIEKEFKSYLASLGATYTTKAEDAKLNDEQNQIIVLIMAIFSYLAMIIASIGVFNNITICFFQRKREFAVMASLGMDRSRRKRLILSESMMSVILSILISIPFGILLSGLMTGFAIFIEMPMLITFSWSAVPKYALVITAIILIASLSTMRKSKKLSVIGELKYE